jgi:DNA-binding NtrC family response regulator
MKKNVCVVEDDIVMRNSLKLSFEDADYNVIHGSSLEMVSAMLSLRKSTKRIFLSAVVADFWLDLGVNGITVIRCLRRLCGKGVRSVLITGDRDPAISRKASSEGLTLLRKPFQFAELLYAVEI